MTIHDSLQFLHWLCFLSLWCCWYVKILPLFGIIIYLSGNAVVVSHRRRQLCWRSKVWMSFWTILIQERLWLYLFLPSQGLLLLFILAFLQFRLHFRYCFTHNIFFGYIRFGFEKEIVLVVVIIIDGFYHSKI